MVGFVSTTSPVTLQQNELKIMRKLARRGIHFTLHISCKSTVQRQNVNEYFVDKITTKNEKNKIESEWQYL